MSSLRADPSHRAMNARSGALTTRTRSRPRKRWKLPKLPRWAVVSGLALLVAAGAAAFGPLAMVRDAGDVLAGMTGIGGMRVEQVMVEGRKMVDRQTVLAAVGLKRGQPILSFDLAAARERLEHIPWVESAVVERRLPDLIYVRLTERTPMALWQHEGRFSVIDAKGVVVVDGNVGSYANLPIVVGADAPTKADSLLLLLSTEPEIKARVAAAVRVGGRRWNLHLDNGVDVKLPEEDAASAVARLAEINRTNQLVDRDVKVIDLRQPDRLVLQLGPNSAERLRLPARTSQNGG
jgi:cell division protein FtsQ